MGTDELQVKSASAPEDAIQVEGLGKKEVEELKPILKRFMDAYKKKEEGVSDREWLTECYRRELPEWEFSKIEELTEQTLESIREYDENLASAEEAAKKGVSSEKWFADKVIEAGKGVAINDFGNYLASVDSAISMGNAQMMRTVSTNAGEISQCYNLDGFIAEQQHVNAFNAEAALKGSDFFAEVKVPGPGETYGKNSVDCVIKNIKTGKIVENYQAKFGATAHDTIKLLKSGNYNNQRFLVPAEQVAEVQAAFPGKTVTSTLGSDALGIASKPLTKADVKNLQLQVQEKGRMPSIDWNTFQTKNLALHIGKNAGVAGLQSAAIATGMTLIASGLSGEQIDSDVVIETALNTGADAGVKAAAAGALKVGAEKGIITILPPGTPAHIIANIACVGIENAKILAKVASGELTMKEALDKMGRTTTAMIYGLGWGATGAVMGAAALSWIPIAGPIVGGLVGGMVGYMAGSKFGETIYNGAKKIGSVAKKAAKGAWEGVKSAGRALVNTAKNVVSSIAGLFRR